MSAHWMKNDNLRLVDPPTGDPKAIALRLKAFGESVDYFNTNHKELLKQYPDRWIAIHQCKVIADAKTVRSLLKETDMKGAPRAELLVEFLSRKPRTLIV